jgi:hypothetical protein
MAEMIGKMRSESGPNLARTPNSANLEEILYIS